MNTDDPLNIPSEPDPAATDGHDGSDPTAGGREREIGCVDGASQATTRRFAVVLEDDAAVELDELVTCEQQLPDGSGEVTHYGIVVEQRGAIEGAETPSDTRHIALRADDARSDRARYRQVRSCARCPSGGWRPSPARLVRERWAPRATQRYSWTRCADAGCRWV